MNKSKIIIGAVCGISLMMFFTGVYFLWQGGGFSGNGTWFGGNNDEGSNYVYYGGSNNGYNDGYELESLFNDSDVGNGFSGYNDEYDLMSLYNGTGLGLNYMLENPNGYSNYYGVYGHYDSNGVWYSYTNTPNGYYGPDGVWHSYNYEGPNGYYDSDGVWHGYGNGTGGGYYDSDGTWHGYGDGSNNGYYDSEGIWHGYGDGIGGGGYYDSDGTWHGYGAGISGGFYDSEGTWHSYSTIDSAGYYDSEGNWFDYGNVANNGFYDLNGVWRSYDAGPIIQAVPVDGDSYGSYNGAVLTGAGDSWNIFAADGWQFVNEDNENEFMTAENDKYGHVDFFVYNANKSNTSRADIIENGIWGYDIDCSHSARYPAMTWNGLTFGDSASEVLSVYGEPVRIIKGDKYDMYKFTTSDNIEINFYINAEKGIQRVTVAYLG